MLILGIETSCDETGVAIYDTNLKKLLSNELFSQIKEHEKYGGVVPEIASRSQLEKIHPVTLAALEGAGKTLQDIDVFAVTTHPGLAGSLFVGLCFAKSMAWSLGKKLIGVNHLEGHIFSSFLKEDGSYLDVPFPHICLSGSGGHTALYLVEGFDSYLKIGETIDDAAGEAFDKIAKILGFGYPGGPIIEKLAASVGFVDYFKYPRTKNKNGEVFFSFSGLKTAVLYDLVKRGAYNINTGAILGAMTPQLQAQVASSLLVCIGDIFENNIACAIKKYPHVKAITFTGGVACNKYLRGRLARFCNGRNKGFIAPHPRFCGDNGAMIALLAGLKILNPNDYDFYNWSLDIGI